MHVKRFRQRATLGVRYLKEYLMDGVEEGYSRTYVPAKPLDIICEITYVCNLECPTCFRWTAKPDEHELTAAQWVPPPRCTEVLRHLGIAKSSWYRPESTERKRPGPAPKPIP